MANEILSIPSHLTSIEGEICDLARGFEYISKKKEFHSSTDDIINEVKAENLLKLEECLNDINQLRSDAKELKHEAVELQRRAKDWSKRMSNIKVKDEDILIGLYQKLLKLRNSYKKEEPID